MFPRTLALGLPLAAGVDPQGGSAEDAQRLARDEHQALGRIVADFGIKGE